MGCGEAKLALELSKHMKKIYSFDLVSINERITVAEISNVNIHTLYYIYI